MLRTMLLCLFLILLPAGAVLAETGRSEPKELSGMSIVGNDEAPKSLYIVPWKSSEIGVETSLGRVLDETPSPVDREVFMRELAFYEVSIAEPVERGVRNPELSAAVAGF